MATPWGFESPARTLALIGVGFRYRDAKRTSVAGVGPGGAEDGAATGTAPGSSSPANSAVGAAITGGFPAAAADSAAGAGRDRERLGRAGSAVALEVPRPGRRCLWGADSADIPENAPHRREGRRPAAGNRAENDSAVTAAPGAPGYRARTQRPRGRRCAVRWRRRRAPGARPSCIPILRKTNADPGWAGVSSRLLGGPGPALGSWVGRGQLSAPGWAGASSRLLGGPGPALGMGGPGSALGSWVGRGQLSVWVGRGQLSAHGWAGVSPRPPERAPARPGRSTETVPGRVAARPWQDR